MNLDIKTQDINKHDSRLRIKWLQTSTQDGQKGEGEETFLQRKKNIIIDINFCGKYDKRK